MKEALAMADYQFIPDQEQWKEMGIIYLTP
jgi:hypothetical protein